MRIVKIAAWIVVLYIIQTAFGRVIDIHDTIPNLVAAFSVIFAFAAQSDAEAGYVTIACAVLSGSCAGRSFPADVLIIGCAGFMSRRISEHIKFIPKFIRAQALSAVTAAALAATGCFIIDTTIGVAELERNVLPYTIYTLAASCVIYPIAVKALFRKTEKKLLVV